ncbi:MAG: PfkB family carbohydrate kinase, partial [Kangiellaceae bacterium]|nr:PfkB family carbohydrate kinase [Kangiellaceae bacterium]
MSKVAVVGSFGRDMIMQVSHIPARGETVGEGRFSQTFGGKGANQAVCAGRLGSTVQFIGCVGNDNHGKDSIKNLSINNVDVNGIRKIEGTSTGIAQITIAEGDNSIIIIKGANTKLTKKII